MNSIEKLSQDERVTVRRKGAPDPEGNCVVYWMQRAQRAHDNPALDAAIHVANELKKPVVVFFAPVPFYPRANLRHYRFMLDGLPDLAQGLAARRVGFVLRTYPDHSLLKFCGEVRPAIVIGDENPLREPERWRVKVASRLRVPFWTVDADVIVPSKLLLKEQFAARTIRPRIRALLPQFLARQTCVKAQVRWISPPRLHSLSPHEDLMRDGSSTAQSRRLRAGRVEASRRRRPFGNSWARAWPTIQRPATAPNKTAPAGFLLISTSGTSVRSRLRSPCSAATRRPGRRKRFSNR